MSKAESKIKDRISELKKSLENLQNNANAHIGAIQELERLLKEIENADGVQAGEKARPDASDVPADIG